ncbi:hypothetical protein [Terasakiella pusilla]|uniref:hypothetical protein n=1 Tax=Terasakiella pusilla TaxID=64973 RepID=UPI003AA81AB4
MISNIISMFQPAQVYKFDFSEAKRRCRILLIDDDENALPIKDLLDDGYNISQIQTVDSNNLKNCEEGTYDMIILDYNGVAPKSITPDDGFGIFTRIRSANPSQYIIAISGEAYQISKTEYFEKANDWINKPAPLTPTKEKIDKGIKLLFDLSTVLQGLKEILIKDGIPHKSADKIINHFLTKRVTNLEEAVDFTRRTAKVANLSTQITSLLRFVIRLGGA